MHKSLNLVKFYKERKLVPFRFQNMNIYFSPMSNPFPYLNLIQINVSRSF